MRLRSEFDTYQRVVTVSGVAAPMSAATEVQGQLDVKDKATAHLTTARWTGVRLADVLGSVGVRAGDECVVLVESTSTGKPDRALSARVPADQQLIPLAAALTPESMLVWACDGQPLTARSGGPVRLLLPDGDGRHRLQDVGRITVLRSPYADSRPAGSTLLVPTGSLR